MANNSYTNYDQAKSAFLKRYKKGDYLSYTLNDRDTEFVTKRPINKICDIKNKEKRFNKGYRHFEQQRFFKKIIGSEKWKIERPICISYILNKKFHKK